MLRATSNLTSCFLLSLALLFAYAAFAAQAGDQATSILDVVVTVHGGAEEPPATVEVVLFPEKDGGEPPIEVTVPLEGGSGSAAARVGRGTGWTAQASAEGFWSPEVAVPPPDSTDPETLVDIALWPSAKVNARLMPPKDGAIPTRARLRLTPSEASNRSGFNQPDGAHWIGCSLDKGRIEQCIVPAGRWNLRLDTNGYSPYYVWDASFRPSRELDLGKIVLRTGGSILGRALSVLGPLDTEKAKVELLPVIDPGQLNPAKKRQIDQLRRSSKLGQWGDFQFVGVAPGLYQVEVEQEGLSPAKSASLLARKGEETRLGDPLVLEELLHLSVQVTPPTDPFGEVWTARLHRAVEARTMDQVASGTFDSSGHWRSSPLAPGPYSLQLLDQQGNSLGWWDVDLERGNDLATVDLSIVFVDGRVEIGDEPLASTVWFGGKTGEERVEVATDEDGQFYAVLPRAGTWRVDVEADSPPVRSRGLEVEIEADDTLRTADAVIEVPDTRIEGEVVDEGGLPVSSARVQLQSYGRWRGALSTEADPSGRFELQGMRPGPFSIEAQTPEGQSEPEMRQVAEGEAVVVRLVVRKERKMDGTVISDAGPVLGARVLAVPFTSAGLPASMRMPGTKTDAAGRFELSIPGSSALVRLMVMAPGYALYLGSVTEGQPLQVSLAREMGTLHLGGGELGSGEVGLIVADGRPVSTFRLETWALMNGTTPQSEGSLTVPAMPPGSYVYCRVTTEEALAVFGGIGLPSGKSCVQGFLSSGGSLTLDLGP